jgi:argininosuccinate synthase
LEDPDVTAPSDMWKLTVDPLKTPNTPEDFTLVFEKGLPKKLIPSKGKAITDAVELFLEANAIARRHGVGRIDIVENRFIGLKSRGCYETPGLTCLRSAHIDLDREVRVCAASLSLSTMLRFCTMVCTSLQSVSSLRSLSSLVRRMSTDRLDAVSTREASLCWDEARRPRSCMMLARAPWMRLELSALKRKSIFLEV